ncbi:hypothetical protein GJAV_G00059380 [Gymnothorax javanicus]|nr:hypothetical protein GJAV_G00059380 [Gymnothorax javanicus]
MSSRSSAMRRAAGPLSVCLPALLLLLPQICSGIRWLALSQTPGSMPVNRTQHCKGLQGLVSAQVQLCRSNLELMQTIVQASREVQKTCQKAFGDMRWNCSSIESAPHFPPDLERGTSIPGFGFYPLGTKACTVH